MNETIIEVTNLGKKYILRHQQKERYTALRDEITQRVIRIGNRLFHSGKRQRIIPSGEEFWALKNVTFEVKHGEVIGIIGRNGAGKSTLLKVLSRITEPTAGRFRIRGRVASLLEVGTGFHPELTGRENIYLNGAILGMSKAEIKKKFDEIVAFSEVEKFLDTPVKRYSSGMGVRLAFSVAAHLEAEILLIDEVLAVGDAAFQKKCMGKMEKVSEEGRTVLLVSHNMASILSICSHAFLMEDGCIAGSGNAHEVIDQYLSSSDAIQDAHVDLINCESRYGAGEFARFSSVSLLTENGDLCSQIKLGQTLFIQLQIVFSKPVANPEIGVAISNHLGVRTTHIVSAWEGFIEPVEAGEYRYTVKIPNLCLVPGYYNLTLWVKREGARSGASDDGIENALSFEVVPTSINGRAPYFDKYCRPGEIYFSSDWEMERV